jgi:ABC-type transporter Mla maintaining outer membrane lipid asymmetry permease subunit MlaE
MLHQTVPPAKATLYAMGMAKLLVLEIGPLLTALLLCGRIGGSYAGKVATMQATAQNKLLQTLGISPVQWSLYPAVTAALIAGPILTVIGTTLALYLAGLVGPAYGIGTHAEYWEQVRSNIFPALRLRGFVSQDDESSTVSAFYHPDFYRTTFSPYWTDTVIEIATYPAVYHVWKAVVFMFIIMGVAEVSASSQPNLTTRGVPGVITSAVVGAGLLVILADWWFSQLWLRRR